MTCIGPRTDYNGTLASGYQGLVNGDGGKAVRIRRGSQLSTFNSIFAGFGVGLFVNDLATAVGQNSDSSEFRNNTFAHMTAANSINAPFRIDATASPLNTISALRTWFANSLIMILQP
jgi:hypothetical protein